MRGRRIPDMDYIRKALTNQIIAMSDDDLYEFVCLIQDGDIPFFKLPEWTMSCNECKEVYGKCSYILEDDVEDKPGCKEKFLLYHGSHTNTIAT